MEIREQRLTFAKSMSSLVAICVCSESYNVRIVSSSRANPQAPSTADVSKVTCPHLRYHLQC